jgi:hypothetical protein
MQNEHHSSHSTPGFGKNTNGLGIFIIAAIFIGITLFTWNLWNNNHKELNHYRVEHTSPVHGHEKGH